MNNKILNKIKTLFLKRFIKKEYYIFHHFQRNEIILILILPKYYMQLNYIYLISYIMSIFLNKISLSLFFI